MNNIQYYIFNLKRKHNLKMKTNFTLIFIVFYSFMNAQVGIQTTAPEAQLDIKSTDKGLLIPRVALTSLTTEQPVTNPQGGSIAVSTMVFHDGSSGIDSGFYFWSGVKWEKLAANSQIPKSIGKELISTSNGNFTRVGNNFIWTSATGGPAFSSIGNIMAPYGSTTSFITVTNSGSASVSDSFTCSKNITSLRFYTVMQVSTASSGRWRTNLFLNGTLVSGNYWGAPPNNVANVRVFGVLEYGPIAAGTSITLGIDATLLPASCQNQGSYFVIEYEL
jgi:hypothetical protein